MPSDRKRDYYEVLGVARGASDEDLKESLPPLAIQFHPDRNPGDKEAEEKFKELNEAYQILSDAERRAQYDRFGHAAFQGPQGPGGFGGFDFTQGFEEVFSDIFGDFFGTVEADGRAAGAATTFDTISKSSSRKRRVAAEKVVKFQRLTMCESCNGSRARGGSEGRGLVPIAAAPVRFARNRDSFRFDHLRTMPR